MCEDKLKKLTAFQSFLFWHGAMARCIKSMVFFCVFFARNASKIEAWCNELWVGLQYRAMVVFRFSIFLTLNKIPLSRVVALQSDRLAPLIFAILS